MAQNEREKKRSGSGVFGALSNLDEKLLGDVLPDNRHGMRPPGNFSKNPMVNATSSPPLGFRGSHGVKMVGDTLSQLGEFATRKPGGMNTPRPRTNRGTGMAPPSGFNKFPQQSNMSSPPLEFQLKQIGNRIADRFRGQPERNAAESPSLLQALREQSAQIERDIGRGFNQGGIVGALGTLGRTSQRGFQELGGTLTPLAGATGALIGGPEFGQAVTEFLAPAQATPASQTGNFEDVFDPALLKNPQFRELIGLDQSNLLPQQEQAGANVPPGGGLATLPPATTEEIPNQNIIGNNRGVRFGDRGQNFIEFSPEVSPNETINQGQGGLPGEIQRGRTIGQGIDAVARGLNGEAQQFTSPTGAFTSATPGGGTLSVLDSGDSRNFTENAIKSRGLELARQAMAEGDREGALRILRDISGEPQKQQGGALAGIQNELISRGRELLAEGGSIGDANRRAQGLSMINAALGMKPQPIELDQVKAELLRTDPDKFKSIFGKDGKTDLKFQKITTMDENGMPIDQIFGLHPKTGQVVTTIGGQRQPEYTQDQLEHTAKKYGMSVEAVKKALESK